MEPRIETITEKKIVGKKLVMSLAHNRVSELWKSFMPERKAITNAISEELISAVIYKPTHFADFKPSNEFEKWAAVEVPDFENIPPGMTSYLIPRGLYAVFHYKGLNTDPSIYQYIFTNWLPASGYTLDERPHFEILGPKYRSNDPASEEEIWIPVKQST